MLFNSLLFLFFFLIVTSAYYLLPHRFRWAWLLTVSCYFYMYFKPEYILIILFTIIIDYVSGILIEQANGKNRKAFLIVSLVANIGVHVFYKYFNFLAENLNIVFYHYRGPAIPFLEIVLPIGLSFHTFQAMSYTIEVYRGNQKAERHFGIYALYVMFYPQMVAGPIERPQQLLPQFYRANLFNSKTFNSGIIFMIMGLFKKVVIADRLALYVDPVFTNPHSHSALDLLLATYFFSFQIYCDFSGYTDIAIGAGLTLGIELIRNFNMPYLACNVADFWKRWHISLSSWFRDYLYKPLGGSRSGFLKTAVNILIVFLISGLWHGANWKYVVWGLIHGCLLIVYYALKKLNFDINKYAWLNWLITFNLVCFAWIFFRAESVSDGMYILRTMFFLKGMSYSAANVMTLQEIYYCILAIFSLMAGEWYLRNMMSFSNRKKFVIALGLLIGCYFLGIFNEAQFIYFQF